MEKRLLVIANIGFIIGIIEGLYLEVSIILFLSIFVGSLIIFLIYKKLFKKIYRYLKLYITKKVILTFVMFCIIGLLVISLKNKSIEEFLSNMDSFSNNIRVEAIIVDDKESKEYSDMYKIKILSVNNQKYSNTYCILKLSKVKNKFLSYGDLICFTGEFLEPKDRSNFKGYSYKEYLKTINVNGTFESKYRNIKVLENNNYGPVYMLANTVRNSFERAVR